MQPNQQAQANNEQDNQNGGRGQQDEQQRQQQPQQEHPQQPQGLHNQGPQGRMRGGQGGLDNVAFEIPMFQVKKKKPVKKKVFGWGSKKGYEDDVFFQLFNPGELMPKSRKERKLDSDIQKESKQYTCNHYYGAILAKHPQTLLPDTSFLGIKDATRYAKGLFNKDYEIVEKDKTVQQYPQETAFLFQFLIIQAMVDCTGVYDRNGIVKGTPANALFHATALKNWHPDHPIFKYTPNQVCLIARTVLSLKSDIKKLGVFVKKLKNEIYEKYANYVRKALESPNEDLLGRLVALRALPQNVIDRLKQNSSFFNDNKFYNPTDRYRDDRMCEQFFNVSDGVRKGRGKFGEYIRREMLQTDVTNAQISFYGQTEERGEGGNYVPWQPQQMGLGGQQPGQWGLGQPDPQGYAQPGGDNQEPMGPGQQQQENPVFRPNEQQMGQPNPGYQHQQDVGFGAEQRVENIESGEEVEEILNEEEIDLNQDDGVDENQQEYTVDEVEGNGDQEAMQFEQF